MSTYPDPIPHILPFGSINLFAGASGVGKTIMLAEWLARMRDGRSICGHPSNPPTAFGYVAADRDWSTYAEAFRCAGFPEIRHLTLSESDIDWRKDSPTELLISCLDTLDLPRGAFLVIDPGSPLFIIGDPNRQKDVARTCLYWRRAVRERLLTLLALANIGKRRKDPTDGYARPQDRIAGSGAFVAHTDTQVYMEEHETEAGVRVLGWVPRRYTAEEFQFTFDTSTMLWRPSVAPAPDAPRPKAAEIELRHALMLDLIPPEGGIETGDLLEMIQARLGVSRATFFRDLAALKSEGRIIWEEHGHIALPRPN